MKLNAKIIVGLMLVIFGMSLMFILAAPSAKMKKEAAKRKEIAKYATITDEATWNLANSCAGFQQVSEKKFGDGIVFMPKLHNDIAQLSDSFRNNIAESNIKIVPLPDKDSPISEKFLKLCMVHKWSSMNQIQQGISNGPQSNKAKVDRMWAEVPQATRDKIDAQLAENQRVYEKLNKFGGFYSYKGLYTKSPDMVGVIMTGRAVQSP